ncbi:MAG: nitrate/sulfonate/bicarbonate ABC transporter ATP-binding protein [Trueperaceae bacterium]|nr:nitrate/sulfonate/bicarbonate ABC transporter ATP-binding protein [Trueperaceae bacterium]MCO5174315.1 nitrate/sulfonate/bicarbonate ABC transporter ATP-binding protein [Trueperaceae bacterium]
MEMADMEIVRLAGVGKTFARPGAQPLVVLEGVSLTLRRGEIVGIVGRSGSGKSTLLRVIAGLTQATAGSVAYRGEAVVGPPPGVAMVFQSFALLPWLTVLGNVELGLQALGASREETRARAMEAIDLIGLDGFEQAFPRELSGGMRQRVGIARALVVHPEVLLMDEPFSALDVLTAEALRGELLELWSTGRLPTSVIVLVTHNIEEAVLMCDRVLVFASRPGRVAAEVAVDLPHPRDKTDPRFGRLVERLYSELAGLTVPRAATPPAGVQELFRHLPHASPGLMAGLIEALVERPYSGHADLPVFAHALRMEVDDLFPAAEALQLLGFVRLEGGDMIITGAGRRFEEADGDDRKALFAEALVGRVPLVAHLLEVLEAAPEHRAPYGKLLTELEQGLAPHAAEETLRTAITWSRYAELVEYDDGTRTLGLEKEPV